RHVRQNALDFEFRFVRSEGQRLAQQLAGRHIGEKRVDIVNANPRQHVGAIFWRQRMVAHGVRPQLSVATNSLYAASSINASNWLLSFTLSFKNQPSPSGSALTLAGSPSSAPLTSITSP